MTSIYLRAILAAMIAGASFTALAHGPTEHDSPTGMPGEAASVTRVVNVSMNDKMRFSPESIAVKRGETVRFVVKNDGFEPHEFMLGELKALIEHAKVMQQHPTMVHDEPNAITVSPGQTGELIWRFTRNGRVDFACLIPGHFEAGMKGSIHVSK
jgi:uncharacterized cupredoxin-like copper-binding protein